MPVLRMLDGEIELFERSLLDPDAVRYLWKNAGSQFGVIFTVDELKLLLVQIGSTRAWDWVWVRKEFDDDRWTQACGRAADGLIVEVDGPALVSARGASRLPRIEVGTSTWSYLAASAETHDVATAARLQFMWLDRRRVGSGYELREPAKGIRRR